MVIERTSAEVAIIGRRPVEAAIGRRPAVTVARRRPVAVVRRRPAEVEAACRQLEAVARNLDEATFVTTERRQFGVAVLETWKSIED